MKRDVLMAVGLCAGVMGVAAMGTWQHGGSRVATAATVTRAVQGPQDPVPTVTPVTASGQGPLDSKMLAEVYGIHFVAQTVADGAPPTLPNGQQGVPMDQAIRAAMDAAPAGVDHQAHRLLPNVQVSAQYTLYSDDHYGQKRGPGKVQPYLQNQPAWVITFYGPGVFIYPAGPRGPRPPGLGVHHEVSVVIDAATGQYLMAYS
jgi:hypothetical protein